MPPGVGCSATASSGRVTRDSERAQTMAGGYACGRVTAEVFAASARAVANIKPDWEADCDQRRLVLSARVRLPGPDGDEDVGWTGRRIRCRPAV